MRRRVQHVAVVAALIAVTVFGLPLGAAVYRLFVDEERSELTRIAGSSVGQVAADPGWRTDPAALARIRLPAVEGDTTISLYTGDARLVAGPASAVADQLLPAALAGQTVDTETATHVTVAMAVPNAARTAAVVIVTSSKDNATTRTAWTWAAMVGLALLALAAVTIVARRQAGRIAAPLDRLARSAHALGEGDFSVRSAHSGMAEIDMVATALNSTAGRLGDLLRRERSFSANASHQLRTPLTGLRLLLESALDDPHPVAVGRALDTIDRLERTIDELLDLARHGDAQGALLDIDALLEDLRDARVGALTVTGRALLVGRDQDLPPVLGSIGAVRQAVAVLVDNATVHGTGTIVVRARDAGSAVAIDVRDDGPGPAVETALFGGPGGERLGLRLARDLVEADGGRLTLSRPGPGPVFTILLPAADVHPTFSDGGLA
ncbi:HAMP domain-containing sensor histidine kinase [Fodinicola feengrottensis]|uniref:histidine kinase n=1 Tax=Fodinicola feengrottensis TaxID=435914 RepID=A0ABN2J2X5_9ACTN|nr:HAMP domain-containing sensor histidine kinase [Fodinicola feengrottensis]